MNKDFRLVIEENTFWKEIKREDIKGDIYCPKCEELLIVIPTLYFSFAYCPNCRKYYELMRKCDKCGYEYSASEIHFCGAQCSLSGI